MVLQSTMMLARVFHVAMPMKLECSVDLRSPSHMTPANLVLIAYVCVSCLVSQKAGKLFGIFTAQDRFGRPVLLFRNEWKLANVQGELPGLKLVPWSRPPDIE